MKTIATLIGLAIGIAILIIVGDNLDIIRSAFAQLARLFVEWLTLTLYAATLMFLIVAVVILHTWWRHRQTTMNRQQDGSYALQRHRLPNGAELVVNPDHMIGPAYIVHPQYGMIEIMPNAGWDNQRLYAEAVQLTRNIQAATPGDNAIMNKFGSMFRGPKVEMNKLLPGPRQRQQHAVIVDGKTDPDEDRPIHHGEPLKARDLIARNTQTRFHLGQNPETGELAIWDVTSQPHARAHGSTGSGKSAFAQNVILSALLSGWRVVILDRKGFKDYHHFERYAELCNATQPAALIEQLAVVDAEKQRRDRLIAHHRAADIEALPSNIRPPRTLIVIEEYGVQEANARAARLLTNLLTPLSAIAMEGRAAGLHLFMVDQHPSNWAAEIKANVEAVFTFRLPRHSGQAAGYDSAHRLPPYHFAFDSEVYRPMHIKPEAIAPGLARSRPSTPPPLIPAELRAGRPIIHNGTNGRPAAVGPLSASAAPAGRDGEGFPFEDDPMTDKQAAAYTWMDKHRPNGGTQADMRKALNLSKGYASQLWHTWQPPTPPINGAPPASPPQPASTAATDAYGRPHHTIHADDPASAEALAAIRAAIESGAATINRRK